MSVFNTLGSIFNAVAPAVGGYLSYKKQGEQADALQQIAQQTNQDLNPFASQRGNYQGKLAQLYDQGFSGVPNGTEMHAQAMREATRGLAQKGSLGSGSGANALYQNSLGIQNKIFQEHAAQLAGLSGSQFGGNPTGSGYMRDAANLEAQRLGHLTSGLDLSVNGGGQQNQGIMSALSGLFEGGSAISNLFGGGGGATAAGELFSSAAAGGVPGFGAGATGATTSGLFSSIGEGLSSAFSSGVEGISSLFGGGASTGGGFAGVGASLGAAAPVLAPAALFALHQLQEPGVKRDRFGTVVEGDSVNVLGDDGSSGDFTFNFADGTQQTANKTGQNGDLFVPHGLGYQYGAGQNFFANQDGEGGFSFTPTQGGGDLDFQGADDSQQYIQESAGGEGEFNWVALDEFTNPNVDNGGPE